MLAQDYIEAMEFFPDSLEIKVKNPAEAPDTSQDLQEHLRNFVFDVEVSPEGVSEELVGLAVQDIVRVFWILVLFAFFLVFVQTYHVTNWMIMRYERESFSTYILFFERASVPILRRKTANWLATP